MTVLAVIALGGNAMATRGSAASYTNQVEPIRAACRAIAPLTVDHQLVITHGNGPQVGLLALQTAGGDGQPTQPFDALGAATEGTIGYLVERELRNVLPAEHMVSTLITLVTVDQDDPAFGNPTKPIGPVYSEQQAHDLATRHGWAIAPDGSWWRRVVPSPRPQRVLAIDAVRALLGAGSTVICAGGGGVPTTGPSGRLVGVEAVIDKDLASMALATSVHADRLILATDVDGVYEGWSTDAPQLITHAHPESIDPTRFAAGSMAPKVQAAVEFARSGGQAVIGALRDLDGLLHGRSGTCVSLQAEGISYA